MAQYLTKSKTPVEPRWAKQEATAQTNQNEKLIPVDSCYYEVLKRCVYETFNPNKQTFTFNKCDNVLDFTPDL